MEVTDDLVRHVAALARIGLQPEEVAELKEHFRKILDYIESFQALETDRVEPSHFAVDTRNVYRSDVVGESLPNRVVMENAPACEPPHFLVPRIVGGADDEDLGGAA